MTKNELIEAAMLELENMPVGGIGADGATQRELTKAGENGMPYDSDSVYHCTQQAWLYLHRALKKTGA